MGMFDDIKNDGFIVCITCGGELSGLQSKSGKCELQELTIKELFEQSDTDGEVSLWGRCDNAECGNDFMQTFILQIPEPRPPYIMMRVR